MKNTVLYPIWIGLAILCALFGLIPSPAGPLKVFMTLLSILFFLPPALLFYNARRSGDEKTMKRLCLISTLSLAATFLLFVLNILSVLWPKAVGSAMHVLLNFVSVPMLCSGHYALSLFLWACLLFCTLPKRKKIS